MSRGQGGRQGETTFICGRVVEMRSDCISMGAVQPAATVTAMQRRVIGKSKTDYAFRHLSHRKPRWITAIVNFAKRVRACVRKRVLGVLAIVENFSPIGLSV